MRTPSEPEKKEVAGEKASVLPLVTGARDPSYPDRARIDSDVRYLLRPPSTPWIVFDQKEPEIGALLSSSRSSVLGDAGVFPETPVNPYRSTVPSIVQPEPSNVVVTTDIRDGSGPDVGVAAASDEDGASEDHTVVDELVVPRRRVWPTLAGTLAAFALVAASAYALDVHHRASAPVGKLAVAATTVEEAPPVVSAPAAEPTPTAVEDFEAPPSATVEAELPPPPKTESSKPETKVERKGFGRLTIRGQAKFHKVYMDGKLLLGQGTRSFTVFCGEHMISIDSRTDGRDVDVPCGKGEIVIDK